MSVLHFNNIWEMVRWKATVPIIPDNLTFGNPKRRRGENPIYTVAAHLAIKIMLGRRLLARRVQGVPGVHEAARGSGQCGEDGGIRGFVEIAHEDQGFAFSWQNSRMRRAWLSRAREEMWSRCVSMK